MPVAPLRVLTAFSCGVALFRFTENARATTGRGWSGLLILVAFVVGTPFLPEGPFLAAISLGVSVVIIGALATGTGRAVDILGSRPMEYGGRISFSVYMTHGIVLLLSPVRFLGIDEVEAWPLPERVGVALAQLLVVLGAGALLYHLVERPGQRAVMSSTSRRTARRA
ncbi:acyltransferase family protein [Labedella phragmitis]|uniref:acyltransferase family protein n=1 Tax=Labedella phragmitis TaxID=2498849 RepID=UPI001FB777F6|nr:hypothetical protein [Labedella phragmitis]